MGKQCANMWADEWKSYISIQEQWVHACNIKNIFVLDGFTEKPSPRTQTCVCSAIGDWVTYFCKFSWLEWEATLNPVVVANIDQREELVAVAEQKTRQASVISAGQELRVNAAAQLNL